MKDIIKSILCKTLALAATGATTAAQAQEMLPAGAPVGGAEMLNLGGGLLAVVGAILVCAFLYSRLRPFRSQRGDVINVLAARSLGPKERILLVSIADKQLVVGMTASELRTLHVFEQPVVEAPAAALASGFASRLRAAIEGMRK